MRAFCLRLGGVFVAATLGWHVWTLLQHVPASADKQVSRPNSDSAPSPGRRELTLPTGGDFAALANQPLFVPSRKPPEIEESGADPAEVLNSRAVELDFSLQGIVYGERTEIALIKSGNSLQSVKLGDEIRGWKLVLLEGTTAVFQQGNLRHELKLNFNQPSSFVPKISRPVAKQ